MKFILHVKFIILRYTQFELFLIIPIHISRHCYSPYSQYLVNLTKTNIYRIKLFNSKKLLKAQILFTYYKFTYII